MGSKVGIVIFLTISCHLLLFVHGDDGNYTPEEKRAIGKLRELAGKTLYLDYMKEDFYIAHFVRARNLNLNEAHTMLREATKWRLDNKIDTIEQESILPDLFQPRLDGHDKAGRPIVYVSPGRWDARRVILSGQGHKLIRLWTQMIEGAQTKVLEARNATGKDIGDVVTVLDIHGYNLRQHGCLSCFANYIEWVRVYENYYPQGMAHFYMINVPRIFQPLLEILRTAFSPHTQKILKVLGTKEEWQPELLKLIDTSELLQHYGGTKV